MALRGDLILICLSTTLLACDEDYNDTGADEACALSADAGIVLASADIEGAPLMPPDTGRIVELPPGQVGYVQLQVTEGGVHRVAFDHRNVLRAVEADGHPVDLPASRPVGACPELLPASYELELTEPGRYLLELGPVKVDDIWVQVDFLGPLESNPSH